MKTLCIDDKKAWMLSDKLKVNDGKTEFLIIGTWQQLNFNLFRIGDNSTNSIDKALRHSGLTHRWVILSEIVRFLAK